MRCGDEKCAIERRTLGKCRAVTRIEWHNGGIICFGECVTAAVRARAAAWLLCVSVDKFVDFVRMFFQRPRWKSRANGLGTQSAPALIVATLKEDSNCSNEMIANSNSGKHEPFVRSRSVVNANAKNCFHLHVMANWRKIWCVLRVLFH